MKDSFLNSGAPSAAWLAVHVALRVGAVVHEGMVPRQVLSIRNVLVASPKLVERFGMPAEPNALHRFPVRCGRVDVPARWELGEHIVEPTAILSTNDCHYLCSRARGGDVMTELPPFLAAAPIREKRLAPLLPQHRLPEWSINLLYSPQRHRSTIVRAYLDFCQSCLPKIVQACEIGVVGWAGRAESC